jgi:hypothetical protein
MVHTFQNLETLKLTQDLEIHQHLGSLKHVINIIMWIRDMRCYSVTLSFRLPKKPLLQVWKQEQVRVMM